MKGIIASDAFGLCEGRKNYRHTASLPLIAPAWSRCCQCTLIALRGATPHRPQRLVRCASLNSSCSPWCQPAFCGSTYHHKRMAAWPARWGVAAETRRAAAAVATPGPGKLKRGAIDKVVWTHCNNLACDCGLHGFYSHVWEVGHDCPLNARQPAEHATLLAVKALQGSHAAGLRLLDASTGAVSTPSTIHALHHCGGACSAETGVSTGTACAERNLHIPLDAQRHATVATAGQRA